LDDQRDRRAGRNVLDLNRCGVGVGVGRILFVASQDREESITVLGPQGGSGQDGEDDLLGCDFAEDSVVSLAY
jgi:hypothetical protein